MAWIIVAAILNTVWTLWCVQLLPPRVATKFGLGGQVEGWMSRKGFAWFSILFPLALAAFIVFTGSLVGTTPATAAIGKQMEHLAAALITYFSFLSWTMVRSNRRNPPRVDYPSLLIGLAALMIFVASWVSGLPKKSDQPRHVSATRSLQSWEIGELPRSV